MTVKPVATDANLVSESAPPTTRPAAHTPGPWTRKLSCIVSPVRDMPVAVIEWPGDIPTEEDAANARLISAAPDHAIFAADVCIGFARWEPFESRPNEGEVCGGGMRYSTELDDFGVPVLTGMLRAVLTQVVQEGKGAL